MMHALTVLLALIIAGLTLTPMPPPGPPGMPGIDKVAHLLAFAALAAPLAWRYPGHWWIVVMGALAYGGLIEIVQPHVGRSRELADLLADGTGAFVGAWVSAWIRGLRRGRTGR